MRLAAAFAGEISKNQTMIEWEEYGYHICGEYSDETVAIQMIRTIINGIFDEIRKQGIPRQGCRNLFNAFTILLLRLCKEKGIRTEELRGRLSQLSERENRIKIFEFFERADL